VSRLRACLIHVAMPLALGVASYVVLRSWVPIIGVHAALWTSAPSLLRDHFADAAWGWALGGFVSVMWLEEPRAYRLLWTLAAAALAAALEAMQTFIGWGAFDRVDLVVQTSAVLCAALAITWRTNRWISAREAR